LARFGEAESNLAQAAALKAEISDQHGLASVLVNMALLHAHQVHWKEVRSLAIRAMQTAQEAHNDESLANAHALLGLVAIRETSGFVAAAEHYTRAVITAWEFHPAAGRRINRHVLGELTRLRAGQEAPAVVVICQRIVEAGQAELDNQHSNALHDFAVLLDDAAGES
jgi:hypothetical protein